MLNLEILKLVLPTFIICATGEGRKIEIERWNLQKKRFTENKVERKEKGELDASKKQAIH